MIGFNPALMDEPKEKIISIGCWKVVSLVNTKRCFSFELSARYRVSCLYITGCGRFELADNRRSIRDTYHSTSSVPQRNGAGFARDIAVLPSISIASWHFENVTPTFEKRKISFG